MKKLSAFAPLLCACLALLLCLSAPNLAHADEAHADEYQPASVQEAWMNIIASADACDQGAAAADAVELPAGMQGAEARPLTCGESDCFSDSQCQTECPSANDAFCSANYTCVYIFGGTGSGGPACGESDCNDDYDCQQECPSASQAYCAMDGTCRYF
ncbi:MAG: hypothetical protein AAGD01_09070 [Acidobacteriota bacterium]